jgi:hypothetical protein
MPAMECGEIGATDDGNTRNTPLGPTKGLGYFTEVDNGLIVEVEGVVDDSFVETDADDAVPVESLETADDELDAAPMDPGTVEPDSTVELLPVAAVVLSATDDSDVMIKGCSVYFST